MTLFGEARIYYEAHVDDDTNECLIWPFGTSTDGYGKVRIGSRTCRVHLLACERHHGPRPQGMYALHLPVICHNQKCFNWQHLYWGTQKQNMADRVTDGNGWIQDGENNYNAKMTWALINEIRARYAAGGITQGALGAEYGMDRRRVSLIVTRRVWQS
jgi:hypothetical protein